MSSRCNFAPSTTSKRPYWAGDESDEEDIPQAAPVVPEEGHLSPGSIFNNGRVSAPLTRAQAASKAFSRGLGGVRKAAGQAKRAVSHAGPSITSPVANTFSRGDRTGFVPLGQEDISALDLVGIELAQRDVRRFGQADHAISDARADDPTAAALSQLTGEPIPPQTPHPSTCPAPSTTTPAPPEPSPRAPGRRVVGQEERKNVFGDIIATGHDASWTGDSHAPATQSAPLNRMPAAGNPFVTLKQSMNPFITPRESENLVPQALPINKQPSNIEKSPPALPIPDSLLRSTRRPSPPRKPSLADTKGRHRRMARSVQAAATYQQGNLHISSTSCRGTSSRNAESPMHRVE
jgi:hypothetical protein